MSTLRLLLSAILALAFAAPAAAQGWPNRPITMVAAFPAGGPTDGIARVLAHELGERLKQRIVVENRGGAGGTLGAAMVAKSVPDGHTLLLSPTGPLGYYRALYKSLGYDPVKDFAPVALIGTIPQVIIVSPKLKAATLTEFIEHARANPGKVNIGDSGVGTMLHILAAQLALTTGIAIQHVHYRGAAGSVGDVAGGQIEAALSSLDRADQGAARRADLPRERRRHRVGPLAHARGAGRHASRCGRAAQLGHQHVSQERARQELRDQLFAADRWRHAGRRARLSGR
jgi:tripartite-type tricarboxylate transporter receptor subunit TctC